MKTMEKITYKTPGYPLDLRRAERFVVDIDEDMVFEPKKQKPKSPVKGKKEA